MCVHINGKWKNDEDKEKILSVIVSHVTPYTDITYINPSKSRVLEN
jgi:hypothetical protein